MVMCYVRPQLLRSAKADSLTERGTQAADLTDGQLAARVMSPRARCVYAALDPDEWFPVATAPRAARVEARTALAQCAACPVRAECLEFALRHRRSVGRYGIWGGLVEAERAAAHRRWAAGLSVETLLS
jgi:WhiB family redox-sensing transcriptional regulator